MPNPKRRHSKTRTAKRRTHDALKAVGLGECPHCHEPKPPHRVCPNLGYYPGRQATGHLNVGGAVVGGGRALAAELARHEDVDESRVRIVEASDVVTMEESPTAALRRKPGASIKVAAELVARGEAGALFSAGHTG